MQLQGAVRENSRTNMASRLNLVISEGEEQRGKREWKKRGMGEGKVG